MTGAGSALTIILIVVFVAALSSGLLFLLGAKRHTQQTGAEKEAGDKPPPPTYREQAGGAAAALAGRWPPLDTMGNGIGHVFSGLDKAINLFFSGLIFLYKWAFNYNGRPEPLTAATVVSEEPRPPVILPPPAINPQPIGRPYGLQAIIDVMGDGVESALTGMSDGIDFIFEGFINLFKWIFRIDRQ